jgi:uncharacterized membrane protein YfcA
MKSSIFSFVIPIIIAALSGMGIGGGGLFVIYLNLFSDMPQIHMQAINLIFFIFAAGASLLIHLSARKIYGKAILIMVIFGILGSLIGSALAMNINGELLGKIFGCMLVLAGSYSFFRARRNKKNKKERQPQEPTDIA